MYVPDPNAPLFRFELVTPEKVAISSSEKAVLLPGEEGDLTILAKHQPMVLALRPGIVALSRPTGTPPLEFFISGGFVDINTDHCIVLAPQATRLEELNRADIDAKITRLRVDLQAAEDAAERARMEQQLEILKLQLDVATR
ncbi:MAG TPA: ATP synthase F1 subunit epsilon [Alphaproteobacteria bacterium]